MQPYSPVAMKKRAVTDGDEKMDSKALVDVVVVQEDNSVLTQSTTTQNVPNQTTESNIRALSNHLERVAEQVTAQQQDMQILVEQIKVMHLKQTRTENTANTVVGKLDQVLSRVQAAQLSAEDRTESVQNAVQSQLEQQEQIKIAQELSVEEIRRQQERIAALNERQNQFTSWDQEMSDPWRRKEETIPNEDENRRNARRHSMPAETIPSLNVHGAKFATVVYSQITNPPNLTPERYEEWGRSLGLWLEINEGIQVGRLVATMGVSATPMLKGVLNDYFESTKGRKEDRSAVDFV